MTQFKKLYLSCLFAVAAAAPALAQEGTPKAAVAPAEGRPVTTTLMAGEKAAGQEATAVPAVAGIGDKIRNTEEFCRVMGGLKKCPVPLKPLMRAYLRSRSQIT